MFDCPGNESRNKRLMKVACTTEEHRQGGRLDVLPIVTLLFQRTIREDTSGRYCRSNLMCRGRTHGLRGGKTRGLSLALSQCSSRRILTVHLTAPLMNSLRARADPTGLLGGR